jgi:hemerythrin superfamily protein
MSTLVVQLKTEHKWLVNKLLEVRTFGGSKKAADALNSARKGLLAHLKKEDDRLYPVLREASKVDSHVKRIVDSFSSEMDTISKAALEFFAKYTTVEEINTEAFKADYEGLLSTLAKRVAAEENVLYPTFAKLEAKWGVNLGEGTLAIVDEPSSPSPNRLKKYAAPAALAGLVMVAIVASFAYWFHGV